MGAVCQAMSDPKCSSGGTARATPVDDARRHRVAWLTSCLVVACLLVVGFEASIWRRMAQLEERIEATRPEPLLVTIQIRHAVERMEADLFGFQVSGNSSERDSFNQTLRQFTKWLAEAGSQMNSESERQLFEDLERETDRFGQEAAELAKQELRTIRRDSLLAVRQRISTSLQPLRELASRLVEACETATASRAGRVAAALDSVRITIAVSRALEVGLLVLAVAVILRVVVSPLRERLTRSEASSEQKERLASLGELAAGVAHEIRNPLTAIKFRLFSLRKSLSSEFAGNEDLAVIDHEIHRLEGIVKDFLQFARPSPLKLSNLLADDLIRGVVDLLSSELGRRGIRVDIGASEAISFRGDQRQLQQVLINLVQNAADAISDQGVITLSVRQGAATLGRQSSPVVIIEVADTGAGIPPEVESRLFAPFVSTKRGGTGLGLAIAARIVDQHGGQMQYSSRVNRGTTFTVVLPKAFADESHPAAD